MKETTMQKKPTKKTPPKARGKHSPRPAASAAPASTAVATATTRRAAKTVLPRTARHRRAFLSAAAARGLDAVKYIRIHERKAYGRRGEQAIIDIVKQAGHLANIELNATAPVAEN
jgi:hypothetical protein